MELKTIKRALASHRMFALELMEGELLKVYPAEGQTREDAVGTITKVLVNNLGSLSDVTVVSSAQDDNTLLICMV